MATRLTSRLSLLLLAFAAVLLIFPAMALAEPLDSSGGTSPAPTIQSDQADYPPGATVTLTGSNWKPGESVHINVNDDVGQTWSRNVDVTADANGNITDQFPLPDWFVATYKVTATGAQSGTVTTSFTDASLRVHRGPTGNPPNLSFTVTFQGFDNNTCTTGGGSTGSGVVDSDAGTNLGGAGGKAFVKLTAPMTPTSPTTYTFDHWTSVTGSANTITQTSSSSICVRNPTASQDDIYRATYKVSNTAPVLAGIGDKTVNEGSALTFTASASDPGDTVSYSLADGTTNCASVTSCTERSGASINSSTGAFTWTPTEAQGPGTYRFKVVATDSGNLSDDEEITVTVNEVNVAPVLAAIGDKTVNENSALTFNASATDADVPANTRTFSLVSGTTNCGSVTSCDVPSGASITGSGAFSWTPGFSDAGTYRLKVKVTDNGSPALSDDEEITITVNNVNRAPVASPNSYSVAEGGTLTANGTGTNPAGVLANDTDPDGDTLTATLVQNVAHGSLTLNADGTFTYVHDGSETTSDSFTYKAKDSNNAESNTVTVTINVDAVNDAPVANDDGPYSVNEGATLNVSAPGVLGNDTDPDNTTLTAELVSSPVNASSFSLNPDGSFTYVHNGSETTSDSFTYRANDGGANSNIATVNITVTAVDDDPVAVNDAKTVLEDAAATTIDVLANDTDIDAGPKTIASVTQPTNGTVVITNGGNDLTYKPKATYCNGGTPTDDFKYKLNGGSEATVEVTVTCVNDAPVAVEDEKTTPEDNATDINVITNDTDVDNTNDQLSVASFTQGAHGTVIQNLDGTLKYTPALDYNGPDSFTYKAKDPDNAQSSSATVTITVTPVNDAPVAVADSYTTDEDTDLVVSAANGLLKNDTDVEHDPLHVDDADANMPGINPVSGPAHGTVTLNLDGSFTYKPNLDYNGSDSFDYRVCDNGSPEPECSVKTAKVNITINAVNDAPVAVNDSATTNEDTATDINVITNDTDVDNTNDQLSVASFTQGAHGTVIQNLDGTLKYTPALDYNGPDSFTYKVSDGSLNSTNEATVSITVTAVNDKPVVSNLQGADTANEGDTKTYSFDITDVDSNTFSFPSGSPNCGGLNKGVVDGTPQITNNNGNYKGEFTCKFLDGGATPTQVSVSVQVSDGDKLSDPQSKNVDVSNVAPSIVSITGPTQPVLTNQLVTFTGLHSDPAINLDTPVTWQWSGGISTDTDKNNSYETKFTSCSLTPQSVSATVTDKDGAVSDPKSASTTVGVSDGKWLPPLNVGMKNNVVKGKVIPVKVSIGCGSTFTNGLSPAIQVLKGDVTPVNEAGADPVETFSAASADTNGVMRQAGDGSYIYNLLAPNVTKTELFTIRVRPFGDSNPSAAMYILIEVKAK